MASSFPTRLRKARKVLDLTTRELDDAAGVSPGYTWRIERGERPETRTDTLRKYAKALGVSLAWLLTGEGTGPVAHAESKRAHRRSA